MSIDSSPLHAGATDAAVFAFFAGSASKRSPKGETVLWSHDTGMCVSHAGKPPWLSGTTWVRFRSIWHRSTASVVMWSVTGPPSTFVNKQSRQGESAGAERHASLEWQTCHVLCVRSAARKKSMLPGLVALQAAQVICMHDGKNGLQSR